jgi:hypothetical protein
VLSADKKQDVLSKISDIENCIVSRDGGDIAIGALCSAKPAESVELAKSSDPLAPILRTSLVINFPESAMKSRYERFVTMFPEISTLSDLKRAMDSTDPLDFCRRYLNINANASAPDRNPKYCLLRELTNGFLEYQKRFGLSSEIEAIRHWSARVNISDVKNDPIGKRHGVGKGVVENIRLNLGCHVVKPDRHVIGVMKKFLQVDIPPNSYTEFAVFIGKDPRYLDCILFEYGKAKNISYRSARSDPPKHQHRVQSPKRKRV